MSRDKANVEYNLKNCLSEYNETLLISKIYCCSESEYHQMRIQFWILRCQQVKINEHPIHNSIYFYMFSFAFQLNSIRRRIFLHYIISIIENICQWNFIKINKLQMLNLFQNNHIQINKKMFNQVVIILSTIYLAFSIQVPPTWVTSTLIKSGTQIVINNILTGNSSSPSLTATMTFSTAFSAAPQICFGLTRYEANDLLFNEFFQTSRTALTATSFSINLQIIGYTNLWYFTVRYIAVDKNFPQRLNCFDNVPVNYSNGNIVNISAIGTGTQFYTNTINFTAQAIASGFNYKNFNLPLSTNKILLFLTAMYEKSTSQSTTFYPLDLKVNCTVLTSQTYLLNVSYGIKAQLSKLHFSMIIFDYNDILSSNIYEAISARLTYTESGGFYAIPIQFVSSTMMGFAQYSTSRSGTVINFNIDFKVNSSGVHGLQMPLSAPRISSPPPIRYVYNIFYLRSWLCQVGTTFDPSLSLCITCPIIGCLTCANKTYCSVCDQNISYYAHNTTPGACIYIAPICGDNIFKFSEGCDDGNTQSGDGCSSTCTVEADYVCEMNTTNGSKNSICYYTGAITLNVLYIQKIAGNNQIQILLQISPSNLSFWNNVNFSKMVTLSNETIFTNYEVVRNPDGTVSIFANYNSDIQNLQVTVELDPKKSDEAALSRLDPTVKNFIIIPNNNEAAVFYDQSVYRKARIVEILAYLVSGFSLLTFILGIFAGRLVGVEMMAVIQISYLSVLMLSSVNPCFKALSKIWFVNGINYYQFVGNILKDPYITNEMKGISLYSRFFENYNLTMILLTIPYILGLLFFIAAKINFNKDYRLKLRLEDWAKRSCCQFAYNSLMFSAYIITISLGLELSLGIKRLTDAVGVISMVQCLSLLGLYALYFVLIIKIPQNFGEYIYFFKQKCIIERVRQKKQQIQNLKKSQSQKQSSTVKSTLFDYQLKQTGSVDRKWYNVLMVERILIGLCLVFVLSPLIIICVYLVLIVGVIIRRPYIKMMHNIRFITNMVICITIQAIYLAYKLNPQSNQTIWFVLPIIICVLLLICIAYSATIIAYEFYQRNKKEKIQQTRMTEEEELNMWLKKQITNANNQSTKKTLIIQSNVDEAKRFVNANGNAKGNTKVEQLRDIKRKIRDDFADFENKF